jgi:hypothetical protein
LKNMHVTWKTFLLDNTHLGAYIFVTSSNAPHVEDVAHKRACVVLGRKAHKNKEKRYSA